MIVSIENFLRNYKIKREQQEKVFLSTSFAIKFVGFHSLLRMKAVSFAAAFVGNCYNNEMILLTSFENFLQQQLHLSQDFVCEQIHTGLKQLQYFEPVTYICYWHVIKIVEMKFAKYAFSKMVLDAYNILYQDVKIPVSSEQIKRKFHLKSSNDLDDSDDVDDDVDDDSDDTDEFDLDDVDN